MFMFTSSKTNSCGLGLLV